MTNYFYIDGDILVHQACYKSEDVKQVKSKVNKSVISIIESVLGENGTIAIKGKDNFRKSLSPIYKANRVNNMTEQEQELFDAAYDHLSEYWGAVAAGGQEADDLLATWNTTNEGIICSIDKDLLQVPGVHYNFRKHKFTTVSEAEGSLLLHKQMLMGDTTDNIKGIPGIGPAKANKILKDVPFKDHLSAVKKAWQELYGRGWEAELQLTTDLVYLRRNAEDRYVIT